jgi:hypothetical protein
MVIAGIFVNIANPRRAPEIRAITNLLFSVIKPMILTRSAKNMEDKKNGNWIPSNNTRISNEVIGIATKRVDAINATILP